MSMVSIKEGTSAVRRGSYSRRRSNVVVELPQSRVPLQLQATSNGQIIAAHKRTPISEAISHSFSRFPFPFPSAINVGSLSAT
jgi:hypothetical protein